MKQYRAWVLLTALSLALTAATVAFCAAMMTDVQQEPAETERVQSVVESVPVQSAAYLLRSVDGEVCVLMQDGKTIPTGLSADLLPQSDRDALQQGIPVHSRGALTALLEDLGS